MENNRSENYEDNAQAPPLQNYMACVNTLEIQMVLAQPHSGSHRATMLPLTPLEWGAVNPKVEFNLGLTAQLDLSWSKWQQATQLSDRNRMWIG